MEGGVGERDLIPNPMERPGKSRQGTRVLWLCGHQNLSTRGCFPATLRVPLGSGQELPAVLSDWNQKFLGEMGMTPDLAGVRFDPGVLFHVHRQLSGHGASAGTQGCPGNAPTLSQLLPARALPAGRMPQHHREPLDYPPGNKPC